MADAGEQAACLCTHDMLQMLVQKLSFFALPRLAHNDPNSHATKTHVSTWVGGRSGAGLLLMH